MLKRILFAAAISIAYVSPVRAADEASGLLSGSVRDQLGRPVPAAGVTAYDASGAIAGSDRTASDGTFSLVLRAAAARVEVRCAHCETVRLAAGGDGPLAILLTRYLALESGAPSGRDLAVLPYGDPAAAAALAPYAVALTAGPRTIALSDRGLDFGQGLVFDGGASLYDAATGENGLFAFPFHSAAAVNVQPATGAFRYGNYAGGGTFAFDRIADEQPSLATDFGLASALEISPHFGGFVPALAISRDTDGAERRRADLGYFGDFGGGTLRADASLAAQSSSDAWLAPQRSRGLATFAYATAARLSRTFISASAASMRGSELVRPGGPPIGTRSSSLDLAVRVERPAAPVTLAYGAGLRRDSGSYDVAAAFRSDAQYASENAYVEAVHDGPVAFDAGMAVTHLGIGRADYPANAASSIALLPSLTVAAGLGGGLSLRAGSSGGLRAPTLFELPADGGLRAGYASERTALFESALGFDDGRRLRIEVIAFREVANGIVRRALDGTGASVAWQISPSLSARIWTLHDSAAQAQPAPPLYPFGSGVMPSLGRSVAWLSYATHAGLRVDAIVARNFGTAGDRTSADFDLVVPFGGASFTVGSARAGGVRRSYAGLRLP